MLEPVYGLKGPPAVSWPTAATQTGPESSGWHVFAESEGVRKLLPAAKTTFDHFHAVKLLGEAVDQVRRTDPNERGRALADPLPLAQESQQSESAPAAPSQGPVPIGRQSKLTR